MKNSFKLFAAVLLCVAAASCTSTRPYAVTNNPIGDETGISSTTLIFGQSAGPELEQALFSTNKNFGVIEAARNGEITRIGCVDVRTTTYLGIVTKVDVIVSGTTGNDKQ